MDHPLKIGRVLRGALYTYARSWRVLLPASVTTAVLVALPAAALAGGSPALSAVVTVVGLVAIVLFVAFVAAIAAGVDSAQQLSARDAARMARASAPEVGMLLVAATVAVAVLVGVLRFVFLILLLVLILKTHSIFGAVAGGGLQIAISFGLFAAATTAWSVALPVAVVERPGRLRAFGRSRELVRGNGWRAFAALVLTALLIVVAAAMSRALLGDAEYAGIRVSTLLSDIVLFPLPVLAIAVLYFELRPTADGISSTV